MKRACVLAIATAFSASNAQAQSGPICDRLITIGFADLRTKLELHERTLAETGLGPQLDLSCHNIRRALLKAKARTFLSGQRLDSINFSGAVLAELDLSSVHASDSIFINANLGGATLVDSRIMEQNLSGANLAAADMTGAQLLGATLVGADLTGAVLEGASLSRADLTETKLVNSDLSRVDLFGATVTRSIWQPVGTLDRGHVGNLRGVRDLRVDLCASPDYGVLKDCDVPVTEPNFSGLNHLIKTLSDAGYRQTEREATAAREEMRTELMAAHFAAHPFSNFADGFTAVMRRILFEIPVDYGTRPFGAIWGLFLSWFLFGAAYAAALAIAPRSPNFALYVSHMEGRIVLRSLRRPPYRQFVKADEADVTRLNPATLVQAAKHGALFSLAMVFRVGFRDVNVGEWISRMHSSKVEYIATGYLRIAAGVQSFISLVLLAVFLLTYFGRPFQ